MTHDRGDQTQNKYDISEKLETWLLENKQQIMQNNVETQHKHMEVCVI